MRRGLEYRPRHWGRELLRFSEGRRELLRTIPPESQPGGFGRLGGQPGKWV